VEITGAAACHAAAWTPGSRSYVCRKANHRSQYETAELTAAGVSSTGVVEGTAQNLSPSWLPEQDCCGVLEHSGDVGEEARAQLAVDEPVVEGEG